MEMFHESLFHQFSGYEFQIFLQGKRIHQMHAHQIFGLYLNRQATAGGGTMATKFGGIFRPGGDIVKIGVLLWYVQHEALFFEKLNCFGEAQR